MLRQFSQRSFPEPCCDLKIYYIFTFKPEGEKTFASVSSEFVSFRVDPFSEGGKQTRSHQSFLLYECNSCVVTFYKPSHYGLTMPYVVIAGF